MPTFCRHNRFVERCPICSRTLLGNEPPARSSSRGSTRAARTGRAGTARGTRSAGLRVRREGRAVEDGYSNELAPGLRASADAARLAAEIEFSAARLANLATEPPGAYGEAAALGRAGELERASWTAFLTAYLSPAEQDDAFASIRAVLAAAPAPGSPAAETGELLDAAARGPRSSHRPGSGAATLAAYSQWLSRNGGSQAAALTGDTGWAPERRFARLYERLALPGLGRAGRYELLVSLGRLGLYELRPDSLQLASARGHDEDAATAAAKRIFGIGDPLLLERRAAALAQAAAVPVETLDLALANWQGPVHAHMGVAQAVAEHDGAALTAAAAALGV